MSVSAYGQSAENSERVDLLGDPLGGQERVRGPLRAVAAGAAKLLGQERAGTNAGPARASNE